MEYSEYGDRTIEQLSHAYNKLKEEYDIIFEESAKEGLKFSEFCDKTYDIKEKMYFLDKYIRLKQDPTVEYGKEWKGTTYKIEQFEKACRSGLLTDTDGVGYYATETTKSDVEIHPSDVIENIIRTDFTCVIWFKNLT